jgi:hypothetical protein
MGGAQSTPSEGLTVNVRRPTSDNEEVKLCGDFVLH